MRVIKFRAWDKVDKIMNTNIPYTNASNKNGLGGDDFPQVLKHEIIYEVMQYTGLKDKNGVDIYEGDILKEYNMYEYRMKPDWNYDDRVNAVNHIVKIGEYKQDGSGDEYCPSKCLGVYAELTKFYKDYFDEHRFTKTLFELNEFEVIGNIYENPELLEKKESDE